MKIVEMKKGPPTIEEGVRKIDDILNAEFGLEKEIVFTPEFLTEEKDPE